MVGLSREFPTFVFLTLTFAARAVNGADRTNTTTPYQILSPRAIKSRLYALQQSYPNLLRVETAQAKYGFPVAGGPDDCPHEAGRGCVNYIATLQDFVAHPENSDSSNRLPSVLLSGALHGDERVGPTAVIELVTLLLEAASCEATTSSSLGKDSPPPQCQQTLRDQGVSARNRQWLARLVTTRRVVIVPTANALGYDRNVRTEGSIDVNRDFPFDQRDPTLCMRSIAARTLNELYRENEFQMSITYHAGMEVIGYQWGAASYWDRPVSPDDHGQLEVAAAMSWFGGSFGSTKPYPYGPSNFLVYPVRGGMEDWAYGGSWDKSRMVICQPDTFGGYPRNKTQYNLGTLRSFVMLVEASDDKWPNASTLGNRAGPLLQPRGAGSGHVSRNIRVALTAIDLVEPYVVLHSANHTQLSMDWIPTRPRPDCRDNSTLLRTTVSVTPSKSVEVSWTVGGAIAIDDTKVWYAKKSDLSHIPWKCGQPPPTSGKSGQTLGDPWRRGTLRSNATGDGRFSPTGETHFRGTLDMSGFKVGDDVVWVVGASVDAGWATVPPESAPRSVQYPQTHLVNARTDPLWHQAYNGKLVQGRKYWYSSCATLRVVAAL